MLCALHPIQTTFATVMLCHASDGPYTHRTAFSPPPLAPARIYIKINLSLRFLLPTLTPFVLLIPCRSAPASDVLPHPSVLTGSP